MLHKTERSDRAKATAGRIIALDRARTFITLLVLIHHSAVNYTHFGSGDKMRWLGFDLVVLFNDSFFMACMFLISGLFVHDSLTRRGTADFLRDRARRLGIPLLASIFLLMPIQTSRILLYAGYFLTGVGIGVVSLRAGILSGEGALAQRWPLWLAFASLFYGAILLLVYAHHNWIADFDSPPLSWQAGYGLAFALFSAAMTFTVLAVSLAFASSRMKLLDAMRPYAYGIFLTHYIFIIWLQYAVYDYSWPAFVKFAAVFIGTLVLSWAAAALLRKVPIVSRMI